MTEYDPDLLDKLGKRRKRATADLAEIRKPLQDQIVAARRAGVPQVEVAERAGMTRDAVYKLERAAGIEAK